MSCPHGKPQTFYMIMNIKRLEEAAWSSYNTHQYSKFCDQWIVATSIQSCGLQNLPLSCYYPQICLFHPNIVISEVAVVEVLHSLILVVIFDWPALYFVDH